MNNETDVHTEIKDAGRFFINGSINKQLSFELLDELNERFEHAHPDEVLEWGFGNFSKKMVVGTGFGPSGIFLIHRLVTRRIAAPVFYLDTRLLFEETYQLRDEIEERFGINIIRVTPELSLDDQAREYGDELWKKDPDRCCYLRKVLPLKNFLADKKAWVTGVRRSQGATRSKTNVLEWDPVNEVVKINPLANWTGDQVWEYIYNHDLPYNPLHDFGYPTIGCVPCTDPVDPEEDERSGRWRNSKKTECGIHLPTQNFRNGDQKT